MLSHVKLIIFQIQEFVVVQICAPMAGNECDSGRCKRPRSLTASSFGGRYGTNDDWVTPAPPRSKKPAAPPPLVPVPAPSGIHDTVGNAWAAGSSVPFPPPVRVPKVPIPVKIGASAIILAWLMHAVPGGDLTPIDERYDLVMRQYPGADLGQFLVQSVQPGPRPGTVRVFWHDYTTPTVMTTDKAKILLGEKLLAAKLRAPPHHKTAGLTEKESLIAETCRDMLARDQSLLQHYRDAILSCARRVTGKPKPPTLNQVTFEGAYRKLSFPCLMPHVALALLGDGPSEAAVSDSTVCKPAPVEHGGQLLPRVARKLRRTWYTLDQMAGEVGIDAAVGCGGAQLFAFCAGVAKVRSPFSKYHNAWQKALELGLHPLEVDTAAAVSNPEEFQSATASAFNATAGGGYVALLEQHAVDDRFLRVLVPAGAGSGYVNLFGRAVVRGRLGWAPADTLETTGATTALCTESHGKEDGTPPAETLTFKFRSWTVADLSLVPTPR